MILYYADTSAVIKLLVETRDSRAFADFYDAHADSEWVSSAMLRIERRWPSYGVQPFSADVQPRGCVSAYSSAILGLHIKVRST